MQWNDWVGVDEECECKQSAIYEFRIVDEEGEAMAIRRLAGVDKGGTLCIGKANNMRRRLRQFRDGVINCKGHSEAKLIHLVNRHCDNFSVSIKSIQYRYSICVVSKLDSSEEQCIKLYIKNYGEVPPFNSAIPKRYGKWP